MSNEPSLPPLLLSGASRSHKRPCDDDLELCTSSDPPLFSSDDHLASTSENYVQKRRKRQYRGTWWGPQVKTPLTRSKRKFQRTADSGVWLGSQDSQGSDDSISGGPSATDAESSAARGRDAAEDESEASASKLSDDLRSAQGDSPEGRAVNIIQQCLEDANERVDLSGLQLKTVPDSAISSLQATIKRPPVYREIPSKEAYGPLSPSLAIFLSCNLLKTVPAAVLDLEDLTVLSLRNNQLTELPAGLQRLTKLAELNVGGNQLQWLPGEILHLLGKEKCLRRFSVHPNPFVEREREPGHIGTRPPRSATIPMEGPIEAATTSLSSSDITRLTFVGASPVQYFDIDGSPIQVSATQYDTASRRVPTLLELSLRSCASSPHFSYLAEDLLASEDAPPTLQRLCRDAQRTVASGGQNCSVCGRNFLIARTEWIEWWNLASLRLSYNSATHSKDMDEVPLRRRGCSWECVHAYPVTYGIKYNL
ncbi:MAG: hypothetical protein M4579_003158 [Chaenotheca gracillima]|nr:MAG: hypothetical protein M4579_003158 [Chaenotheca gracillima]